MGGIAGIVYPDTYQITHLIYPMLNILKHPGKNSPSTHTAKNIQIGSCEGLFSNPSKTIFTSIDGQLINSQELIKILQENGFHVNTSTSPGELILHAYTLWGANFIESFDGDFCIAILDLTKDRILLYRDRIGKKTLYWYQDQHFFIFASELKALLTTGAVPQTPAIDAVTAYLYFGYIPQDMSAIKGVNKLLPGQYLQLDKDGSIKMVPYWSYSAYFEKQTPTPQASVAQNLDILLTNSVKSRIIPDQPAGCFVSGGLGSASIAHYVQRAQSNKLVSAYSVGFSGQNDEDMAAARTVVETLSIKQYRDMLTPKNYLDHFTKIMWHLDEPLADPNVTATWRMAEIAREHVDYVFSGMGSDELLAGHSRYTSEEQKSGLIQGLIQAPIPVLRRLLFPLFKWYAGASSYHFMKSSSTNPWQYEYLKQNSLFSKQDLSAASPKTYQLFDPEVFLHKFHHIFRIKSRIAFFLYFDVKTRLPDCFIQQYEKITSAHGLTWEAPYLDRQIMEYLASIAEPDALSMSETASPLKILLKEIFPENFVNRPKKTRRAFLRDWIEVSELKDIFQLLPQGILVESGILSKSWLQHNTSSPENRAKYFRQLWGILALEVWFKLYIQNPLQTQPPNISLKEFFLEK